MGSATVSFEFGSDFWFTHVLESDSGFYSSAARPRNDERRVFRREESRSNSSMETF